MIKFWKECWEGLSSGKALPAADGSKIVFLNSVFLFAGIVAFGMGFLRMQSSALMGALDFVFSIFCFGLLGFLNRNKHRIEFISSLAIISCYLLFLSILLLAPYNHTRISLFFLLLASAFFLKGRRVGLIWLLVILLSLVLGHVLLPEKTGYSDVDILTTCLYLIALLFIFNNYEVFKEKSALALLDSEQRFREIFDQASVGMAMLALDGRFLLVNEKLCEITGYGPETLVGLNFRDITHPEDMPSDEEYARQLLSEEAHALMFNKRYRHRDGRDVWVNINVSLIRDGKGNPLHFIAAIEDISLNRQLQKEIADLSEQQMRQIGMELHDNLGQQLTGIALLTKTLENQLRDARLVEAEQASVLVNHLNASISTVRSMAHGLYAQEAEKRGLATSLLRLAKQATELTGIACEAHVGDSLPELRPEVSLHLYRITQEAIQNAVRHGGASRIVIKLDWVEPVALWLRISNDATHPDHTVASEPGMGMQMMRYRANLIGAVLMVNTAPATGSTVVVELPIRPSVLMQSNVAEHS